MVLFAVLGSLMLLGTGAFIHIRFQHDLRTTVDAGLSSRAEVMLAGIDETGVQFGDEGSLIDPDEAFAQILGSDGALLESSPSLKQPLLSSSEIKRLTQPTYYDIKVSAGGEQVDARVLAAPSGNVVVVVAASLEQANEASERLLVALLLGGASALVITTLIGWAVAGAAMRPVERMRAEAAEITADQPGRRLQVPGTADELSRLGETLNAMLARLEQAIERERRFVDDASHELRTPLGILKTELELALRKARTPEELEAAIRSAAEESDRLNSLAEDLLVLARSDRGRLPVRREDTDVFELVGIVAARYRSAADARGVEIVIHGASKTRASVDQARLQQALGNLIDNALRHAPVGGAVEVAVASDASNLRIRVSDNGPGFPDDFLERAFEPFTRSDAGRGRTGGGAGLGLAIVRSIVDSHGGRVTASNDESIGAVVSIDIPV